MVCAFKAGQRLTIAVAVGFAAFLLQLIWLSLQIRLLVTWNLGAWVYRVLAGMVISRADAAMTQTRPRSEDQSADIMFLLTAGAAGASFVAIGLLMGGIKDLPFRPRAWNLALSISALISPWLLIHPVYAFHFARRYCADHHRGQTYEAGGLLFPGEREPDYLDFAYYSFVIGMTSQVSYVTTGTRAMRRLTLIHGILAFIFHIAIVAMSINIIASVI